MSIAEELKELKKEEARLAKKKKALLDKKKVEEEQEAKLEALVKNSGFPSAKALVEALIEKYNIRTGKRKAAPAAKKRTRTTVTKELRDAVKKEVKGGTSMNAASKQFGISYVVVSKIVKGAYDKLK